jgi:hypothetical protein
MTLGNQRSKRFPMLAVKLEAVVPDNRRLVLQVPDEIPAGTVEIVILAKGKPLASNGQAILDFLAEAAKYPIESRSAEDIEADIQTERSAWE